MSEFRRWVIEHSKGKSTHFIIHQNISDPFSRVERVSDDGFWEWIRANSHGYLCKKSGDGEVTICQLNDRNWNYYADGTSAVLTGAEGDVMIKLPEFYFYCPNDGRTDDDINIYLSMVRKDENYVKFDGDRMLCGAYEGFVENSKLYSRSGVDSTASLSTNQFQQYAENRGDGYGRVDWEWNNIMAVLYYGFYNNTDCQSSIGYGTDSYKKKTGLLNSLGMVDTSTENSTSIKYWGFENWWGNKGEWMAGITREANSQRTIVTDSHGSRVFDMSNGCEESSGLFVTHFIFGRYLDLLTARKNVAGSSSVYYFCDWENYTKQSNSGVGYRSHLSSNAYGGVGCSYVSYPNTTANVYTSSRLAFSGSVIEEKNVTTFKALPIL